MKTSPDIKDANNNSLGADCAGDNNSHDDSTHDSNSDDENTTRNSTRLESTGDSTHDDSTYKNSSHDDNSGDNDAGNNAAKKDILGGNPHTCRVKSNAPSKKPLTCTEDEQRCKGNVKLSKSFQRAIWKSRLGLNTNPFPQVPDCAFVQCWDAGGQDSCQMAHVLFMQKASMLMFVVNLEGLGNDQTREEELRYLCEWMELAYSVSSKNEEVRPIIVGTREDLCGNVEEAWKDLKKGLRQELGTAVYDAWVRSKDGREPRFVAIENSRAIEDPGESGLEELASVVPVIHCIAAVRESGVEWEGLQERANSADEEWVLRRVSGRGCLAARLAGLFGGLVRTCVDEDSRRGDGFEVLCGGL